MGPGSPMHDKRHFCGNVNTRANLDLPVVDIINLIHKAAAAMWPLATTFIVTCLFAVFVVMLIELFQWLASWNKRTVACKLEQTFPTLPNVEN